MGKPDWRNPDDYPDEETSTTRWAWEFLRRNSRYREAWRRFEAIADGLRGQYEAAARETYGFAECESVAPEFIMEIAWVRNDEAATSYDPPRLESETAAEWLVRVGSGVHGPLDRALGSLWGLERLIDPALPLPPFAFAKNPGLLSLPARDGDNQECVWLMAVKSLAGLMGKDESPAELLRQSREYVKELVEWGEARTREITERNGSNYERQRGRALVDFDLSLPYKPQIERAADHLEYEQEQYKAGGGTYWDGRNDPQHYPKYLRVLDALEAFGYPDVVRSAARDIASVMNPTDKGGNGRVDGADLEENAIKLAEAWIDTAVKYRDGGYMKLVAIADVPARHSLKKNKSKEK